MSDNDDELSAIIKTEGITTDEVIEAFNRIMETDPDKSPEAQITNRVISAILQQIAKDRVPPERIIEELNLRMEKGVARGMESIFTKLGTEHGN